MRTLILACVLLAGGVVSAESQNSGLDSVLAMAVDYLSRIEKAWETTGRFDRELHEEMWREMRVYGTEGLHVVAGFLHNETRKPTTPCRAAGALSMVERENRSLAAELLIDSLPMEELSGDQCVAGSLVALGPDVYNLLAECASSLPLEKGYWCLMSLVAQTSKLPEVIELIGLGDGEGNMVEPPTRKKQIRKIARLWREWWQENSESYTWDAKRTYLREK